MTYQNFNTIAFPIFRTEKGNWDKVDGLLMLDDRIIDDTNMPGHTLGIRRLQTHTALKDLVPLPKALYTLAGLIKGGPASYIDSKGKPFFYKKTKFCALKYYRIKELSLEGTHTKMKLYQVKKQFKLLRPPEHDRTWAGILHIQTFPWILYDFSDIQKKPSRKKV
jgi:hypothetical protein